MELREMICKRKSFRKYTSQPVDAETLGKITAFCDGLKPLYPDIKVRSQILPKERVKCFLPWTTPQLVVIFSEKKEGYLENVGFLYQQLDLYLQSIGLGTCWLGMGRLEEQVENAAGDGLGYVIMLAFGHPKEPLRQDASQFRRKPMAEISDQADPRLECARLAPSSVNSQPWHFVHEGEAIHAYCREQGLFSKGLSSMNRIDMGIALAHLYVENPDSFRFFRADAPNRKGYGYIGSVML